MIISERTTKPELLEQARSWDLELMVIQQIVIQLRRIDGWNQTFTDNRRRKVLDLVERYLDLK